MEKKNIVWITFNAFLDTDLYIVEELATFYNINWHIIRSGNDKFEYAEVLNNAKRIESLTVNLHVCGMRLRRPECILYYNKMLSEIKKSAPDLVFTSMAGAPYFVPILAMKIGINKTIIAIHNVHVPKGGNLYYFFKLYNKFTIGIFKNFQTFSKSQYNELKKLIPKKNIMYAPFMLKDYGKATVKRTNNLITFLNFGNIREYKRIDVLIKAAQLAYERTKIMFRVIIAGQCTEWNKYQKLIHHESLFDLRIGRIENEDIPNLFSESDYFVAPYQDIAQSGSSIVALNYSKPIIASQLPAFEEYIQNNKTGYLIKPADVESLTYIMEKILRSGNKSYKEMVNELEKNRTLLFSKDVIMKKYREFINEIIGE